MRTVGDEQRKFIPAAGHDWLLPLYDPLLRWIGREELLKRPLIDQAGIQPGHRILDVGCGTGSLTVLLKRLHPGADVHGLDPDPKALAIAGRKSEKAGMTVEFDRGFSDELPYPESSFDRVFSSFMFHHLTRDEKLATLRDIRRVLRPGGSLHLLDFGRPGRGAHGVIARLVHRSQHMRDNLEGRIPSFMSDAGFATPEEVSHRSTIFGSISYYRAAQPGASVAR
jgi:ubiquinone/menaquinone biosynthesis C-methylase UbiE